MLVNLHIADGQSHVALFVGDKEVGGGASLRDDGRLGDVDPQFKDNEEYLKMFWTMSVDQFYKIERALIEEIDWSEEKWPREGTYFKVLINSGVEW